MPKEEKSLEEIARSARKGITFPEFETLRDFETKALRIARKYDPDVKPHPTKHARGIKIIVNKVPITVCEMQIGKMEVISRGVLEEALDKMSNATNIPYEQLELYFRGRGKPYKSFKRRFEEEYEL
ncbi:hypothetical protein B6U80_02520 [Candidatus Pacearchaeota archaeon ex4484_26]|nr:MAG: hypothetical protein B6U80_02520 [Candidatus Pacearchaeota archaeon ex4484_26]